MMAAAVTPPGAGRPSVEAPLHELLDATYVIHLHPGKVNGMTCAKNGRETCAKLFPEALWIDYIDPGATLALEIKKILRPSKANSPVSFFFRTTGSSSVPTPWKKLTPCIPGS